MTELVFQKLQGIKELLKRNHICALQVQIILECLGNDLHFCKGFISVYLYKLSIHLIKTSLGMHVVYYNVTWPCADELIPEFILVCGLNNKKFSFIT